MAIRTMIRGLTTIIRSSAYHSWRGCPAVGAMVLLISTAAVADYAAGLAAFNRKDFAHAFSEWIESGKAGDAHAQHGLGMLYELGHGVPKADPKAAAEWYQKAAAQNYAPALNNLARLYADGRGVTQDLPKAIELWSRAADAGNVTAGFNLGLQYAAGSGVPKDMKKAADYLLKAAESGLPEAQFAVAEFYRDGKGVAKNVEAARQWFDRAATAGFEPARAELAALDKSNNGVSAKPAIEDSAAAPSEDQQSQKTETPASQSDESKNPEKPTEMKPEEAPPAETQQATTPPAEAPKQPETSPPAESPPSAAAPAQEEGVPANAEPENQAKTEQPAPADGAGMNAANPPSDLPVATSLTGDVQVYRIWLYTSGQEGDARSYWDKLNQQYPRLLGKMKLDLRRYFLGEAKGSLYRVFAGPFDTLADAQKACEDIKMRSGGQFCRTVLN